MREITQRRNEREEAPIIIARIESLLQQAKGFPEQSDGQREVLRDALRMAQGMPMLQQPINLINEMQDLVRAKAPSAPQPLDSETVIIERNTLVLYRRGNDGLFILAMQPGKQPLGSFHHQKHGEKAFEDVMNEWYRDPKLSEGSTIRRICTIVAYHRGTIQ
jgi:hypothetical protein